MLLWQSRLSIQHFGWQFWQTGIWNPVAGEFGARPFIWGTLYSSVLALLIADPSPWASQSTFRSSPLRGSSGRWFF